MHRILRVWSALQACLLLVLLLTKTAGAEAPKPLTVLLDWFINPDHAPLLVAQNAGIFADYGLEVELVEPADPSAPPFLVAAGVADLAITYQPNLHLMAADGLAIRRVGSLVDSPLNSLVVLADGPVRDIGDLAGRNVGFSVGGFEDILLGRMLESAGLSLEDVTRINVNFNLSPSLYAGQVDAVIGAFRNFELNQMDIDGQPGRAFFPEAYGVPPYEELVIVAAAEASEQPAILAFLAAITEATALIQRDPDAGWKLFIEGRELLLDDALNRRAWADTVPLFSRDAAALNREGYEAFEAFLIAQELIDAAVPLEQYARIPTPLEE